MNSRLPPVLIAISPGIARGTTARLALGRHLKALFEAGLEGCVIREPGLSDADLLALAVDLRQAFTGRLAKWICIHDRVHVAVAAKADAVHLGFRSLDLKAARSAMPRGLGLGLSTHAHDDQQSWKGADYLFHGPVFETPSKAGRVKPVGLEGLKLALQADLPVWALGGITPANLCDVLGTGVSGAAMLGSFARETPPGPLMKALTSKLDGFSITKD